MGPLAAAARGWAVFPLIPGTKRPAMKSWPQRATADPERVAAYWSTCPDAGYGIACGPSKLLVLDLDVKDNGPGELFKLLDRQRTCLRSTFTVETPSGGLHYYYAAPDGIEMRNTAAKVAPGIDTRASGGYVVGPGTHTVEGPQTCEGTYTVLLDDPVAPLPEWLIEVLTAVHKAPTKVGNRRSCGTSTYGRHALESEAGRVALAAEGERNDTLNRAAFALGQLVAGGEVAFDDATAALETAALRAGLTETETTATIRSGLVNGARQPRTAGAR